MGILGSPLFFILETAINRSAGGFSNSVRPSREILMTLVTRDLNSDVHIILSRMNDRETILLHITILQHCSSRRLASKRYVKNIYWLQVN